MPFITVSGQPTFEQQRIQFPSGAFNLPIRAELASVNATFGFNQNPHRFELQYIPELFNEDRLPSIGSGVTFTIGDDFFISGRIKHADYSQSARGNILSVAVEDIRTDLNDIYIDTYGVFGQNDAPSVGVVDVRYWFINEKLNDDQGRTIGTSDLLLLEENGASYQQLYEAIQYFETTVGTISNISSQLPNPEVIANQLPFDANAFRFKFRAQPLLEVISKILNDISYDFYYNMSENKINVINRKFGVNIARADIPLPGDSASGISIKYGIDEAERPTNVRLYGGEMEGIVGSGRLLTQSGGYGLSTSEYDLGLTVGSPVFTPGWRAKLRYFGPDGFLNEYVPEDRELAMALKSLEHWALEKDLDNRIGNFTIDPATGETVEQRSVTGSGIGLIINRRQDERSWILEWYNRVRQHATNNFGRTYILSPSSVLYDDIDNFDVVNAGWSNLENQTDDGSFIDGYKISDQFRFLAPFWDQDANKLRAFAVLPQNTKYGIDGESTPARFTEWNEDEDNAFVPIEAFKFNSRRQKFKEEFLSTIEEAEKGVVIRFPTIIWDPDAQDDENLQTVLRLGSIFQIHDSDTTLDVPNPYRIIQPLQEIRNIGLPVKVKRRYGFEFPTVWGSGTGIAREVLVRDDLVPWNFEPRGNKNSFQLMEDQALSAMDGRIVNRAEVTFGEVNKVGLPIISFDGFADQQLQANGFGIVNHGITNLSLTQDLNWWQTKYSLKSHFPQQIKAQPIRQGIDEDFNFAIKRLEEDILRRNIPDPFSVPEILLPTDDGRGSIKSDTGIEHTIKKNVKIVQIFDRGSANNPEFYLGLDERTGIKWPRALAAGFGGDNLKQAFGIDGFFQIGMPAIYNLEKRPDGSVIHFFTGGVPLEATKVVSALSEVKEVLGTKVIDVLTLPFSIENPDTGETDSFSGFSLLNVPLTDQDNVPSITTGEKLMLSGDGNLKGIIQPGADLGPGSTNFERVFVVNTRSATGGATLCTVTTAPSAQTGRGGVVQIVDAQGNGTVYTDGGTTTAGKTTTVQFIGAEPGQVRVGDAGMLQISNESNGDLRIFVLIPKSTFGQLSTF